MRRTEIIIFVSSIIIILTIGLSSLFPAEIYSSAAWKILWIVIFVMMATGIIMGRLWRNMTVFIMHISFLCMIAGGFCNSLFSRHGTLHLSPSETAGYYVSDEGRRETLPEAVTLLQFAPEYYPGMTFPKDFKSDLLTASGDTMHISMNHIGKLGNHRFYQTSYDQSGGTILTVTYDPIGIAVTYTGFLLFALSGILWLGKKYFKSGLRKKGISVFAVLLSLYAGCGEAAAVPAVDARIADSLSTRQVLFNGETVSFTKFAHKFTYKLTGRGSVGELSPETFVASLIKYKEDWSKVPFLKIKSNALKEALSVDGKYAAITDLYNENGDYVPEKLYKEGSGPLDKDILILDEKVALLIDLWTGELFTPLMPDSDKLRSDFSIKSEILYYHVNPLRILFICAILCVAVILLSLILKKNLYIFPLISVLGIGAISAYGWLWYISGSVPLSNTGDIMEFVGVCMILLSGAMAWRKESNLLVALGMAAASFLLLVALLGMKDPVLSPVLPVLASPWLSVHVSLVMLSYAILGFTLPIAITAICISNQRERLSSLALTMLAPGIFLLGMGIITGAMWANVSWGRYWAWDPKETWSLVTFLLYSIPLHKYFKMNRRPIFLCIYLILAFSSVIMTYFGVNLLPSLHAYN
ncbi:MAG: cytochrome c biogenesis protein CcsA [Muribaculaceae bacterium]|nr:cytochrome c biogenesis protein CcsA [Muribaculaceae bacterium]